MQPYAQHSPAYEHGVDQNGATGLRTASPSPLGLGVLAFTTAILGSLYAGFFIPFGSVGAHTAVGIVLLIGGIVEVLAGMWAFRKDSLISATVFTAYGGFLSIVGLIFMSSISGISTLITGTGVAHFTLGLFFLSWTIFLAVLVIGSLRSNVSLIVTLCVLFIAYVLLTIGQLTNYNGILMIIGAWVAIASAIIAWISSGMSLLTAEGAGEHFRLPQGD